MSRSRRQGRGPLARRSRPALWLLGIGALALGAAACSSSPSPGASSNTPGASSNTPASTKQGERLVTAGLKAESEGHVQTAIHDFEAAVAASPNNQYAYYDLGVIYQQQLNNLGAAASWYQKALLVDPKYRPALFNLAILDTVKNPTEAINLYKKILQINPNDADTNFNLGILLISQHQTAQGQADISKALALDPSLASRLPKGYKS